MAPPASAPTNYPRTDLVTTFLTGIKPASTSRATTVTASEMLRLNTAIEPVPFAQQNRLGVVGNILAGGTDLAGYPNGRRPKDDVVDISLVAVMGGLCLANGNANGLGLGAACKPSAVPLGATAFKPARRGGPGRGASAAGLSVPEHADPRHQVRART